VAPSSRWDSPQARKVERMALPVSFRPLAQDDVEDALSWSFTFTGIRTHGRRGVKLEAAGYRAHGVP
jgi:hypothetical protein